ncbi:MAG: caspase family protein [Candidatus Cloacimonadaceae bacterium]|nr:caspase family protein [Candidatus Cloacimonadaceae bacterium]MDP3113754.1 caspase family protein [Candidatus Cloacimonadaceae bacterium]
MKKLLLVWMAVSLALVSLGAQKALVIGNAGYSDKPLKHPVVDAQLIDTTLVRIGFQVTRNTNLNAAAFKTAIAKYAKTVGADDLALFYFSGQAVQLDGATYLLPVGTTFKDATAVKSGAIELSGLITQINKGVATLVFIDAARANPNVAFTLAKQGLAAPGKMPDKLFLMFSAAPDSLILEGRGTHGNFALQLSRVLILQERDLEEIGNLISSGVKVITAAKQNPRVYNSIAGELIINPSPENGARFYFRSFHKMEVDGGGSYSF